MVGQCLLLALFFQKFIIFGGKSARCRVKKWSDWKFFFLPFLTFYRFTRTAQWYFVKGVDLKVPHTSIYIYWVSQGKKDNCISQFELMILTIVGLQFCPKTSSLQYCTRRCTWHGFDFSLEFVDQNDRGVRNACMNILLKHP